MKFGHIQARVLEGLDDLGPSVVSDLSVYTSHPRPRVRGALASLARRGLVVRYGGDPAAWDLAGVAPPEAFVRRKLWGWPGLGGFCWPGSATAATTVSTDRRWCTGIEVATARCTRADADLVCRRVACGGW